jgi:hypothetical protein
MARMAWRKQPNEKGLARICQGPRGYELRSGGEVVMHVAPKREGFDKWAIHGWYFYGLGYNSLSEGRVFTSPEDAKGAATAYAKANLSKLRG